MFRSDQVLDRKTNQRLIERRLFPPFVNFTHELTLKILVFYSRGILNSLFCKHRYFDIFQSDICHFNISVYWEVKRLFFDSKEKKSKTWDKIISCDIVRERTFLPFSFLLERNYTCFQENSRSLCNFDGYEVKSYDIPGSRKMARF